MSIDPALLEYYAELAETFPVVAGDARARRARFRELSARLAQPRPVGLEVSGLDVPLAGRTLRARLYRATAAVVGAAQGAGGDNNGAARAVARGTSAAYAAASGFASRSRRSGVPPLIVYFHGGGWVVGDLDSHDALCAQLALDSRCAVASIDYRLAPEHPFPAPCDDALDALFWFAEHRARLGFATATLGVGGDSAGAHLASGAAHAANARIPGLVKAQLLLYPIVSPVTTTDSYLRHTQGPGLTRDEMIWYWAQFHPHANTSDDPRVVLTATPPEYSPAPAIVTVAGSDPLRDEGIDYARFLQRHGARVDLLDAHDMTHGFARMQAVSPAARRWQEQAGHKLGRLLGTID